MEHKIKLIDSGADRYLVEPKELMLGRQYDNEADKIIIERPVSEAGSVCVMLVTDINGNYIDHITISNDEYLIQSHISMNKYVKIGFRFFRKDGYSKGSEILVGRFKTAQKPYDFSPNDPKQKQDIDYLVKYGIVDIKLVGNEIQAFNMDNEVVVAFDLSPFTQEQVDLGETDVTRETFVKGKKTSNLQNDGEDGTSPYATEEFVRNYTPQIEVDAEISDTSENPVQNKTIKKYVDDEIAQIETEISTIPKFAVKAVSSLPTTDISTTTIYLVPSEKYETENYYDEYIYVDGKWELIGTTKVDLTDYARIDEENTFTAKQNFSAETQFDGVAEHNADIKVNNSVIKVLDNTETEAGTQKDIVTQYGADEIVVEQNGETYNLELPKKSGTFALDSDMPTATDITTGEITEQDFKGTVLLTAEQMETLNSEGSITIDETTYTDDGSVLFLTEDEGTQSDDALLYTAQELTEEEQTQVCSNLDLESKFVKAQVANSGELKVYCISGTNPHDVCLVTDVGKPKCVARYATSGQLKSTVDPVDDTDLVRLNYIKNKLNHQQVYFGTTLPSSGLGTTYLENDVFILNNSNGTKNFYQVQLLMGGNTNLAWIDIVDFEKPKWQVVAPSDTSQVLMTEVTIVTSDVTNFTGMDGKKVTVNGYTADGFSAGTVVCDEIDGDIPYSPTFIGSMTSTRASGVFVKGGSVTIVNVDNPEVTFTYKYLW